ncbi:MAG: recombinase XerC [Kangiella sp.]|nr:MAG: recombinase XerC [Kangiella sp.]
MSFDKYFTEAEERQLFNAVKRVKGHLAERDYCWMRIARLTGIRLMPLSKLTVGDALQAISSDYLKIGEFNKNKKEQSIFMVKEVKVCLKKLINIQRQLVKETDVSEFDRPLILSRHHTALTKRNYQRRFEMWIEIAGLERGTIHWLRHTFAKRIIKRNENTPEALLATQKLLGHANINTTTIYTSPDKETIKEMMINAS